MEMWIENYCFKMSTLWRERRREGLILQNSGKEYVEAELSLVGDESGTVTKIATRVHVES